MNEDVAFFVFLLVPILAATLIYFLNRHAGRRNGRPGWRLLLLGNFLWLVLFLGIVFVAGEFYFRFFYDTTDALAYTKVSRRWFQRYYRYNPEGFRDNIRYSVTLTPGKRRISFVGDSFTAGHGVASVEDRFLNRIRSMHPEWEVHLIGEIALDTGAETGLLKRCLSEGYQVDQVVLVYCLNDVSELLPEWREASNRILSDLNRGGWLRRNSYFFDIIYHRVKAARNPYFRNYFTFVHDGYRGQIWEEQKQRLTHLRDMVEAAGGNFLVVTFPFLQKMGKDYDFQFEHDELNAFWKSIGVPHLDLLPAFKQYPSAKIVVNRFDPHPNEFAHEVAAQKIEEFLRQQISTNSVTAGTKESN